MSVFNDPTLLLLVSGTFLVAGGVKGVIGLGLPTVSLILLTMLIDLKTAMALIIIPAIVTNIWQATAGKHTREVLITIWPFLIPATLVIWPSVSLFVTVPSVYFSILLGTIIISYATISLTGFSLSIPPQHVKSSGFLLGVINGMLSGMTGSYTLPGIIYLQAIGLRKEKFIQALGMLFALSSLTLGLALNKHDLFTAELAYLSAIAVVPALVGMVVGQLLRERTCERVFRRLFYIALLFMGALLLVKAAWSLFSS